MSCDGARNTFSCSGEGMREVTLRDGVGAGSGTDVGVGDGFGCAGVERDVPQPSIVKNTARPSHEAIASAYHARIISAAPAFDCDTHRGHGPQIPSRDLARCRPTSTK